MDGTNGNGAHGAGDDEDVEMIGEGGTKQPLELKDVLELHMQDGSSVRFEVVGLVEDDEDHAFAVCYNEAGDEFAVTTAFGELLDDEELAQEILDDFFVLAEESAPEGEG